MATKRTPVTPTKKPHTVRTPLAPRVPTARADGRPKSALTIVGDQAKLDAETALLRDTLVAHDWVAAKAGAALGITDAATVSRAIDRCGLRDEYEKHNRR